MNDTADHTRRIDDDNKMVKISTGHQRRDEESCSTSLDKRISKLTETEAGQHMVTNKLKEDSEIMWHKVTLRQKSKRKRLPKLKETSKLINPKDEINGITAEILEENETGITELNNVIYATATIITKK